MRKRYTLCRTANRRLSVPQARARQARARGYGFRSSGDFKQALRGGITGEKAPYKTLQMPRFGERITAHKSLYFPHDVPKGGGVDKGFQTYILLPLVYGTYYK